MSYGSFIKEIGRGAKGAKDISENQAAQLFGDMLDGTVPDLELGAILIALRIKSESDAELRGFQHALNVRTAQFSLSATSPRLVVLPTYNGARRQPNLTPLLAQLLAQQGVPVLLQGRHDFESRTSPFELLELLGITPAASIEEAQTQLAAQYLSCIYSDLLSPGLTRLLSLRQRMGVRTVAHTMAKLLDPAIGQSVRVVAVTHPEYLERMNSHLLSAQSYAMLLRGTEGETYANPRRCPEMLAYAPDQQWIACQQEEGGAPPLDNYPEDPAAAPNAALIQAMLAGNTPIPAPILLQAAALMHLSGTVDHPLDALNTLRAHYQTY